MHTHRERKITVIFTNKWKSVFKKRHKLEAIHIFYRSHPGYLRCIDHRENRHFLRNLKMQKHPKIYRYRGGQLVWSKACMWMCLSHTGIHVSGKSVSLSGFCYYPTSMFQITLEQFRYRLGSILATYSNCYRYFWIQIMIDSWINKKWWHKYRAWMYNK